jgi:hypothetical protein
VAAEAPSSEIAWTVQSHKSVVLTTSREAVIQPHAVEVLSDDGAIVAGSISATKQGWASRVDASGAVIWTFTSEIPLEDQKAFEHNLTIGPVFRSIAVTDPGDTFLCGDVPREPNSGRPTAYIAQLDKSGRLVREIFPAPVGAPTSRYQIGKCFPWHDGIIAIAEGTAIDVSKGLPAHTSTSAWIIWFDRDGVIKRQVLVPAFRTSFSGLADDMSVTAGEKGFLLAVADYRHTEFVSVDHDGHVLGSNVIDGYFRLIPTEERSAVAEAFGANAKGVTLLRLDSSLAASVAAHASTRSQVVPRGVSRLAGGGLFVFGSFVHNFGERYTSAAMLFSDSLATNFELQLATGNYTDAGSVWAAAQQTTGSMPPTVVVARPHVPTSIASSHSERGAIVDFIQLRRK